MELKQKHLLLLNKFIKDKTLSIEEIENTLNIKKRSVYLYIDDLNHFLKINHFNTINKFMNYGYTLDLDFEKLNSFLISNNMYFYNSDERIELIAIDLITNKKVNVNDLSSKFKMDVKTIRNDINKTITFLKDNNIDSAYKEGNFYISENRNEEINIRGLLASIINKKSSYINNLNDSLFSSKIDDSLLKIQSFLCVNWTVSFQKFLNLFIQLLLKRLSNFKTLINIEIMFNLVNYDKINSIIQELFSNQNYQINNNDIDYLILLMICWNIINSQSIETIYPYQLIKDSVDKFINNFEKNAYLNIEDKNELAIDLLKHLIPAYYRSILKMDQFLEKIDDVDNKYKEYFLIAKKNIHYIEDKINVSLSDNEISYLILHIISGVYTTIKKRKIQVGLFCNHPNGIYKMIENKLYKKLNDISITKLIVNNNSDKQQLKNYDLLISTSYIGGGWFEQHCLYK